jgi:transposase InsO family protein
MAQHPETGPVAGLGEGWEVRRSGLYADRQGQATVEIDVAAGTLVARVKARATQTGHRDGSRRMAKPLQAEGDAVGRDNARRLRPPAGVSVRRRQRCPVTTASRHGDAVAPHLLARQFAVAPPETVWVGDSTDVWTAEGWASLAVVLDGPSRTVVGWARQSRIDAALVQEALRMALGRRRPAAGLIHQSARGRQ